MKRSEGDVHCPLPIKMLIESKADLASNCRGVFHVTKSIPHLQIEAGSNYLIQVATSRSSMSFTQISMSVYHKDRICGLSMKTISKDTEHFVGIPAAPNVYKCTVTVETLGYSRRPDHPSSSINPATTLQ